MGLKSAYILPGVGSHKANFTCPEDIALVRFCSSFFTSLFTHVYLTFNSHLHWDPAQASANTECIEAVDAKKGDLVIFLEATLHGALPWVATTHERRSIMVVRLLHQCTNKLPH